MRKRRRNEQCVRDLEEEKKRIQVEIKRGEEMVMKAEQRRRRVITVEVAQI